MKWIFTICLFTGIAVIFLFSTCKKSDSTVAVSNNLTGTWSKSDVNNVEEYTFNSDHTFEYDVFAVDTITSLFIGYRSKMTGRYSISSSAITFYNIQSLTNKNNSYGPTTDLVQIQSSATMNYTFTVDFNKLSLYFICPSNADCVPSPQVFYKLVFFTGNY